MEKRVCECYAVVKKEYDRLLPRVSGAATGAASTARSMAGGHK
jgi:hypothetical protein